jgi:hypothetical protein
MTWRVNTATGMTIEKGNRDQALAGKFGFPPIPGVVKVSGTGAFHASRRGEAAPRR